MVCLCKCSEDRNPEGIKGIIHPNVPLEGYQKRDLEGNV